VARRASETDFLTGLANRRALVAAAARTVSERRAVALILVDLDGFKPVNDTFGHKAGDELLRQVAVRLNAVCPGARCVARLGGDEFAVLLSGADAAGDRPRRRAERLVRRLGQPYQIDDLTIAVTACCGYAGQQQSADTSQLMREADLALYQAKRLGHSQSAGFSRELQDHVQRRTALENALRMPGVEREIELAFQPIVDLDQREIHSFEALARWRHSTLGPISPAEFIPISEQILVIERVSDALLSAAARQAARWPRHISLSFNLSAVQLCALGSAARLCSLIRTQGLDPSRLEIEVTETAMMADFDQARANLSEFRRQGVRIVLDDFGAGYASISYLREMQFDVVKLDGSLVEAGRQNDRGMALLRGVIDLCRGMGVPCVAEHLESEAHTRALRAMGCRYGQGYWLGCPMTADAAAKLVGPPEVSRAPQRVATG